MRKVTRRQARSWLAPMRACLQEMRSGFAPAARGYPVTRLSEKDDWVRIDYCIAGFRALIVRLFADLDTPAMFRIQRRLSAGVLISTSDIDLCMRELKEVEDALIGVTVEELKSAVATEQIAIELEAMQ